MANGPTFPWLAAYPVDIAWDAEIPPQIMPDLFDAAMRTHADKPCLRFLGKEWSYREVGEMANRVAKGLQDLGLKKGDRVGLCLPNSPFYVAAYHGILKAGLIVVNFNPLYAEKEIEEQINDSGVEVMVTLNVSIIQPKIEGMLGRTCLKRVILCDLGHALPPVKAAAFRVVRFLKRSPRMRENAGRTLFSSLLENDGNYARPDISPEDVAVFQYTGGTTGIPKAAQLTHANITTNTEQALLWFMAGPQPEGQARMLAVLPFFHVFSMTVQMNLSLRMGAALILMPKFELIPLLKTIDREKPTIFAGVPTLYRAITACPKVGQYDLSSLKLCVSGGAPLTEGVRVDFKALTGLDLVEGYGLSETSPITNANPIAGAKKAGSIGPPLPRTEVRIVDMESGEVAAPRAEGELRIKGPQVMKGYWNRPDADQSAFDAEGYFRTGDIGYMDEDGYVFIVDRIKDMIIASGFKVFPRRVEEAVALHPAVSEVLCAGVAHEYRGETVKVWVVRREGMELDKDTLEIFLKDKLAPYEMPKHVAFRESLPKTLIGKPDRKALLAEEKAKNGKA